MSLETAEGNIGEEPQVITTSNPEGGTPAYDTYREWIAQYYRNLERAEGRGPLEVKFIQANEKAKLPYMAHEGDACSDVYSVDEIDIQPGETKAVDTGLKVAFIPKGHKVVVFCRSGFGFKSILVANAPGQIDEGYRGNLKILIHNASQKVVEVRPGDRIAQIALEKVIPVTYAWTETSEDTDRGVGGFGSSGIK